MVTPNREEQAQYNKGFDDAMEADKSPDVNTVYSEYSSPLGQKLNRLFKTAESNRQLVEDRWLKDLRQYRGEYDPEILAKLHPKRSKAFLSFTRSKVKTVTSRMTDLLFPANGKKNWGIQPTPIPELSPEVKQNIMEQIQQLSQSGQLPSQEQIMRILNDEANRRSDNMQKEMEDQLAELAYRDIIRNCIHSGGIYGTGILKGPLAKEKIAKRWFPDGKGNWVTVEIPSMLPYCEFVPIWDIYPDMSARKSEDMRYIFQRYSMNRNQLYELGLRSDFNGDAINAYLKAYPEGDASYKTHEEQLRAMASGPETTSSQEHEQLGAGGPVYRTGKFEVLEYWGFLSSKDIIALGIDIPEEQLGLEFAANIWMIGDVIVKGIMSPLRGVTFPYHFYYYEKDDTSIFGEGIPTIMRDVQTLLNAAIRAMLDNAAISAGPIIEANMNLLEPGEDPTDLFPFRVFKRDGVGLEAQQNAITVHTLPSYTQEFMLMVNMFVDLADEVTTTPRYLAGNDQMGKSGGAQRTASGLSMLMSAANITLKDQVKNFDDGITVPFIKGLYFWNMQFNYKPDIKGDFEVDAKGSSSLIAKEVMSEHLNTFLQATTNDIDMMYIKRDNLLREVVKNLDLDALDLIKSRDQVKIEQKQRDMMEEKMREFEMAIAWMKAASGGHMQGMPPMQQGAAQSGMPEGQPIA